MNFDINILTSTLVIIIGSCLLTLLITECIGFTKNLKLLHYSIYVIILLGTYFLTEMFRKTSNIIKEDVILTVQNTEKYNGFNDPIYVFVITFIGVVIGVGCYYTHKYIKNINLNKKK